MPKIAPYLTRTGRQIAFLVFGTAFLYGVGSSLPGAVVRYYTEKNRQKEEGSMNGKRLGEESNPSGSDSEGQVVGTVKEKSLFGLVESWLRNRWRASMAKYEDLWMMREVATHILNFPWSQGCSLLSPTPGSYLQFLTKGGCSTHSRTLLAVVFSLLQTILPCNPFVDNPLGFELSISKAPIDRRGVVMM